MNALHNTMGTARSPYLQQHAENPVAWQEWGEPALAFARANDRPLFVSVGYSTCHWCHVMAAEAFSNPGVAAHLNAAFVPIKVDREERPDIDRYMMEFLVALSGRGGWPLNVFLTPDLKPMYALTYASVEPRYGMPSFVEILKKVQAHYSENKGKLQSFELQGAEFTQKTASATPDADLKRLISRIHSAHDAHHGGFGDGQKFPPHTTLLFLLHTPDIATDTESQHVLRSTLDAMARGGLHDHLGGGFFRYCTDTQWHIPHFEKMLYDQALLLWNYACAYHVFKEERYRETASGILGCLRRSFCHNGLFISAHDADTHHREGASYLWSVEELQTSLSAPAFAVAQELFDLEAGRYEGRTHLVLRRFPEAAEQPLFDEIRRTLGELREKRPQPFADRKIVTSWNALAGCALVAAYRYGVDRKALSEAQTLHGALAQTQYREGGLVHSSLDGEHAPGQFLEDYAALALFSSMLEEHEPGSQRELLGGLSRTIESFREGNGWMSSRNADFLPVPENDYDSPLPSPASLAEAALSRMAFQLGRKEQRRPIGYGRALVADFRNIVAMGDAGLRHEYKLPNGADFSELPVYSIYTEAAEPEYCYRGACTRSPLKI